MSSPAPGENVLSFNFSAEHSVGRDSDKIIVSSSSICWYLKVENNLDKIRAESHIPSKKQGASQFSFWE